MKPESARPLPPQARSAATVGMTLFCAVTLGFLVYRDLTLPDVGQVEVWFGLELHGVWAQLTAPIHWAVFGGAALAFWRRWPPIWPLAIAYALYIALGHLVWNLTSDAGGGLDAGLTQLALFGIPALGIALLNRSPLNRAPRPCAADPDPPPH